MSSPEIYRHPLVARAESFFRSERQLLRQSTPIQHLHAQFAERLWLGRHQPNFPKGYFTNYHPNYLNGPESAVQPADLQPEDCELVIARDFGFRNAHNLPERSTDPVFQKAVDLILDGNVTTLKVQLENHPDLIQRHSAFGHRATLLHYLASNGVEIWRQKVPLNLPSIATILLEAGADPSAKMQAYGGSYTTLQLLKTSSHPDAAGIEKDLEKVLSP